MKKAKIKNIALLTAALAADPCFGNPDMEAFLSLETEGVWQEVLKYDYFGTI